MKVQGQHSYNARIM